MFHSSESDAPEITWKNPGTDELDITTIIAGDPQLDPTQVPPEGESPLTELDMPNDIVGFEINSLPELNLIWVDNGTDPQFNLGSPDNGWTQEGHTFQLGSELVSFDYQVLADGGIVIVGILDVGDIED